MNDGSQIPSPPLPRRPIVDRRATDAAGNVQPATTDPRIANKRMYWESNGQITRRVLLT